VLIVDPHSPTPPFEQIRAQLAAAIRSGQLPSGSRLPPIRRLAEDLGLAVNTVARAYRELESAGLVLTRGRHGTQVIGSGTAEQALVQAAAEYWATVRRLGIEPGEAIAAVAARVRTSESLESL
jgi:DNA-binding transcriptional regulator YhcF (GntR family)